MAARGLAVQGEVAVMHGEDTVEAAGEIQAGRAKSGAVELRLLPTGRLASWALAELSGATAVSLGEALIALGQAAE